MTHMSLNLGHFHHVDLDMDVLVLVTFSRASWGRHQ
jgi:hypothetical protein